MKKTWVIKVGSSLLTASKLGLNIERISQWADDIAYAKSKDIDIVLVSSGSIAEGMVRMGFTQRPKVTSQLQACAAIGQSGLIQAYQSAFNKHNIQTAQILLTHEDMAHRERYLNAKGTLMTCLRMGVVPIVNENDTVVIEETRFGDNDTLGALVANMVSAEKLILLTDQQGLYDKNPRENPDATLIKETQANNPKLVNMAKGPGSQFGSGGMLTKVLAAQKAERSGTHTMIANGQIKEVLKLIIHGENPGTTLYANEEKLSAKKQWLAAQLKSKGEIVLDDGAVEILRKGGKSLLPVGVTQINGNFRRGDLVYCISLDNQRIATGLVNYSSSDAEKIKGQTSQQIEDKLGYCYEPELIHRDNLVLL